jgi:hypothetical protein
MPYAALPLVIALASVAPESGSSATPSAVSAPDRTSESADVGETTAATRSRNGTAEALDSSGQRGYEKLSVTDAFRLDEAAQDQASPSAARRRVPSRIDRARAGFFDDIGIEVSGLATWARTPGHDPAKFVLYVNGDALSIAPDIDRVHEDKLYFPLRHPDATALADRTAWKGILGRPDSPLRPVRVTVGLPGMVPVPSNATLHLVEFEWRWFLAYVVFLGVLITLGARAARTTAILRAGPPTPFGPQPYSLGRSQMAWWFLLVAASYVFIWMLTGDAQSLTSTVLVLMGISAGTALGAVAIDARRSDEFNRERQVFESEISQLRVETTRLEEQVKALAAGGPASAPEHAARAVELTNKKTLLGQKQAELNALNASTVPQKTKGFWTDILSDGHGITLHRFQMAVWTGVLSIIFVASVYNVLSIPEFSTELLGLMGISGGTYLGFKMPERAS